MADPYPAPVAEDVDETAARRSIRVTLIIIPALLLPMLGVLPYLQVGHRPDGVHHRTPVWALVFILTVVGVTLVASGLMVRRQYRRPRNPRVMQ